ncbi:TPA_exp: putative Cellular morphogenesis protein (Bud22) [Trichophyton benhamiae CBS 112371]|uniref:Cellular morphogenesis protein (Bud22), putative n=1 Tax=Arthroderma benhamiae (strain ATCC MYA-4681 / CBS 112371) TaxID=663331 RepID=D4B0J0_ARTBC|nr:cellular morphogenesis protein (Bud22), putative [Trichophyton benhamiae CBS 112371]EFE31097.1 cellular morphogenesis protein (Bud22), putative [Trichophyton benhamiae CBS 112371]DAA74283.1 TPA_exp: putative Cellular morphogenesis protein (Bud22) [Trichophyton benhamiae CBS 112371]
MAKRKRDVLEEDGSYNWGDKKLRIQRLRLDQAVQHGVVLLHRALKVARGFERQKLGRREKSARQESDRMLLNRRLNEVEALKALDLHKTAERYLIKQMVKTKRIAESPAFIHLKLAERISNEEKKGDAEANVSARLFNSNPVKKVFPGVMNDIRDILGLSGDTESKKVAAKGGQKRLAERMREDIAMGDNDESTDGESEGSHGDEEMNMARFDGLVASGSENGDGSDYGDNNKTRPASARYNPMDDMSLSPTSSDTSDESDVITTKSSKPKQKSTTATTFLPTLMGGYWSGSESEPEQDYTSAIPERKNRMGQQARRKLWEKKYGSNARHIQKQAKEQAQGKNRDSGWDLRRGATTEEDTRGRYGRNKIRGGQRKEATGSNTAQVQAVQPTPKPAPPNNNKPLHPSWQAAIKRKQSKAQTSFQGKKVVFD